MSVFVAIMTFVILLTYCAWTGRASWLLYLVTGFVLIPLGVRSALHVGAAAKMPLGINPFFEAFTFATAFTGCIALVMNALRMKKR